MKIRLVPEKKQNRVSESAFHCWFSFRQPFLKYIFREVTSVDSQTGQ